MSTREVGSPPKRRSLMRFWLRWIVLGAAVGGLLVAALYWNDQLLRVIGVTPPSPQDEILEAHRRQQAGRADLPPIELPKDRSLGCPEYRGCLRDGVATGPLLARNWKISPPYLYWRQPIGGGFASFAVVGNAAVTLEQRRNHEAVVCYDTATGQERWVHSYPASFRRGQSDAGPRATPTIAGEDVYSLGATGWLVCLEAATGRLKWSVDILKGNKNLIWGMSGSPLVYDNVVVVNPGTQVGTAAGGSLAAYDRSTGQLVWQAGTTQAGYSSPMLATLAGRRQVLLLDGQQLGGYDAATGSQLWHFPWNTQQGINVAQPLVLDGDRVYISSGYSVGCALVRVAETGGRWTVEPVWQNTAMHCKFTSPVAYRGFLYGLDEGILVCVDAQTGKRQWKEGRYGHGQLLRTDDLLLILAESGELVLVEATPKGHHELGRIQALEGRTWNMPVLVDGKAYLRNDAEMACYDLSADQI